MKLIQHILLVSGLVIVTSCKKDKLPDLPVENDPYYTIKGLVNGDSINWIAGLNNVTYNYGTSDVNGVETYYGQINDGFTDKAIRIEIVEPEIVYSGASIAAIQAGKLNYLVNQGGLVKFNFGMDYGQANYLLVKNEFNDFIPASEVAFTEFGLFNLTFKFTDFSSSESFVIPVRYGFEYSELNPHFHSTSIGDTLIVHPDSESGVHSWYVNGQLVSENGQLQMELVNGIYQISHKLKDQNGNVSEYTTLIRMNDGELAWQMKYYYLPPTEPSTHYGNVIISMRKNGIWYTSTNTQENMVNNFSISNVVTTLNAQYEPQSTLFDFSFGSLLYNEDQTDSLSLPLMTGSLSVGLQ